jgi:hypothetical protein
MTERDGVYAMDAPVDALAGRLILIHLDDPASVLTKLARYVRPGGIVTFQDITDRADTSPRSHGSPSPAHGGEFLHRSRELL